jgi:hypothetical protein
MDVTEKECKRLRLIATEVYTITPYKMNNKYVVVGRLPNWLDED